MSEQKFKPRLAVKLRMDGNRAVELVGEPDKYETEYLSITEHQHLMAEKDKRIERLREALEFYSRNGGASDTHDRKGCWILARRFCFVEAIAHDCEKLPYGETGTEYYMAGKLARAALQEDK